MTKTETSREYAEALFTIACEENAKQAYKNALNTVNNVFNENTEYMEYLICPAIPMSERLTALDEAFAGNIPDYILYFLKILCEKRRISLLADCIKEYKELYDASEHTSVAKITSAIELTEEQKKRLELKLEKLIKKNIIMEYIIDPKIMGGISIETEGRVIDGSLRRCLQEVKDVISG